MFCTKSAYSSCPGWLAVAVAIQRRRRGRQFRTTDPNLSCRGRRVDRTDARRVRHGGPLHGRPALPPGLSLNALTGVITGTPTKASAPAVFLVHAMAPACAQLFPGAQCDRAAERTHLWQPGKAIMGVPLAPLRPTISGTVSHYAVSPTLPPGIVLDSTSGIVSGAPEAREPRGLYHHGEQPGREHGSSCC